VRLPPAAELAVPTAQTLSEAATPERIWMEPTFGDGTTDQVAPSRCSIRDAGLPYFRWFAEPTAHTSFVATPATPLKPDV